MTRQEAKARRECPYSILAGRRGYVCTYNADGRDTTLCFGCGDMYRLTNQTKTKTRQS